MGNDLADTADLLTGGCYRSGSKCPMRVGHRLMTSKVNVRETYFRCK